MYMYVYTSIVCMSDQCYLSLGKSQLRWCAVVDGQQAYYSIHYSVKSCPFCITLRLFNLVFLCSSSMFFSMSFGFKIVYAWLFFPTAATLVYIHLKARSPAQCHFNMHSNRSCLWVVCKQSASNFNCKGDTDGLWIRCAACMHVYNLVVIWSDFCNAINKEGAVFFACSATIQLIKHYLAFEPSFSKY